MNSEVAPSATRVLAIVGATATGKSEIAVKVAALLGSCEIVSADSMQIYRGMDIGTAKPGKELTALVPHHLVDIIDVDEEFSAARFQKLARDAIVEMTARGRLPILVGGSGLYIRAVIDPLDFSADRPDSVERRRLEELGRTEMKALIGILREIDPEALDHVDLKNPRRVTRAVEAAQRSGKTFTERYTEWQRRRSIYNLLMVGLKIPREQLTQRIERRIDAMIEAGLEREVRALLSESGALSTTALQALGYKEIIAHIRGELTLPESVELIKVRTRRFSKRQMTWFRRDPRIHWIEVGDEDQQTVAERIFNLVKEKEFIVN